MPISVMTFLKIFSKSPNTDRRKQIQGKWEKLLQLALAIYVKCQHLQELALRFRQRRWRERGDCRKFLRWVRWKRSGFLTTLLCQVRTFNFLIFSPSASKCQTLSCWVGENGEWRSSENNSDRGTKDSFF